MSNCLRPTDCVAARFLCPWDISDKSTGVGCYALLQGIFPTQVSNLCLLQCRQVLLPLNHPGSPCKLVQFSSVQSFSHARLFPTPSTPARQASLSITNSRCSPKPMSIESVLHIRWAKYWSFSFSISPSNGYSGLIFLGLTGLISLQSKGHSKVLSNIIVQKHQFFCAQLSL